ncbi:hypothetical protein B9Z55_012898 [Caenorhabditis nigoni]|uniref:Acyl_transf_3 domain-containing protein n=1 Tax=Caenorhabditis nigoni TaxID=1611254 RepID=A0A2G5TZ99_9PELO|nr:hypothetical protein B9Z55_012898 [Caenorhabditis nigoni]
MTPIKNQKSSKRDDLQGIRGLAILAVLGFHFYPKQFPNGYLGVDQFFVLSGFLMCMLLAKSQQLPTFSFFTQFYLRRFKRILPLYFLFILCAVFALYTFFQISTVFQNQLSAGKALIFISNRPHTEDEDYFEKLSMAMDLFTHTWSLSVEIQFYFIVPFIFLIGLQLKGASRYIYYSLIAILSFIFHIASPQSVSFNSVFARIWQFLIGMMAYMVSDRQQSILEEIGSIEKDEIFVVDNRKDNKYLYEALETMEQETNQLLEDDEVFGRPEKSRIPIFIKYTVLVISMLVILSPEVIATLPARLFITIFTGFLIVLDVEDVVLNSRFLIFFGDISYALYLIHYPIYAYIELTYPEIMWVVPASLIASILLAILVNKTYERWYLEQSNTIISMLTICLFLVNAIYINKDEIQLYLNKNPTSEMSSNRKYARLDNWNPNMTFDDAERLNAYWNYRDNRTPELQEIGGYKRKSRLGCDFEENRHGYKIAILGNSYATTHHKMIIQECRHRASTISMADVVIVRMAESLKKDQHALRGCFLYEFLLGTSVAETHRKICQVIGESSIHYDTVRVWFHRFKGGDYNLEDKMRSGRPKLDIEEDIGEELEREPKSSVREVASSLGLSKNTVHRRLRQSGRAPKFGQLVPHDLTEPQKTLRCTLALSLLSRKRNTSWIGKIVTGDEKWCFMVNHNRKRQWVKAGEAPKPDTKPEIHEKKVMLSIWWDQRGIIYRELLPDGTTVNADVYCSQIQNMVKQYRLLRPESDRIILLHDNARPHTALKTRNKIRELDIEVLPHPPYSPDLAPTDYHLFHSLQNHLRGRKFDDRAHLETDLKAFFDAQPAEFYAKGIQQLPARWQLFETAITDSFESINLKICKKKKFRWFAVAEPYDNGPDNLNNDTIYLEMKSQLKKMLPNIKKKLFILDSFPRVRWQGIENIAKEMNEGKKTMEEINKSLYEPKQFEFGRHRHAELVKNECGSKCELIDYMDAFWNKTMNAFQYFDSKGFSYFTTTIHMSAHGIELVRPIYTKICAGL